MKKNKEVKVVFILLALLFVIFLAVPVVQLLLKSILGGSGISLEYYKAVFTGRGFGKAVGNSFLIAGVSASVTTLLAFFMAYTIHYTNIASFYKKIIRGVAVLPMLLPTITYGFAIIYSFGKQGLLTKLFGTQLFEIYGFNGLLLGYVIYTLPISFMLIDNTMRFIDPESWVTMVCPPFGLRL